MNNDNKIPKASSETNNSNSKDQKVSSRRKGFQLFFAFIAGMLFVTLLFGVVAYMYGIGKINADINKNNSIGQGAQQPVPGVQNTSPASEGKESVTEEELKQYVTAKDCTTLEEYSSLAPSLTRQKMKSISLDKSELIVGDDAGSRYARWKNVLPKVVDKDCKALTLTQIKAGDTLNLYSLPADAKGIPANLQLIQKIN